MSARRNGERRMPVRVRRVALEGEYAGWWIDVRLNVALGVFMSMQSTRFDQTIRALAQMIVASNYVDDAGAPIDLADPEGWKKVGLDLVKLTIAKATEAVNADPLATTSAPPRSPRSSATTAAPSPAASPS